MNKQISNHIDLVKFRWTPWVFGALVLMMAFVMELIAPPLWLEIPTWMRIAFWSFIMLSLLFAYLYLKNSLIISNIKSQYDDRNAALEDTLGKAYQRLEAIFQVNQKFVDASNENEVVEPVLVLVVKLIQARGAAFVPLDEHGQPQAFISHGDVPTDTMDIWVKNLASTTVQDRCSHCKNYDKLFRPDDCPLLTGPFKDSRKLYCLSVKRGDREFGVLSMFMQDSSGLDEHARTFLRALVEELALGLDSVRLRRNELAALQQMQRIRQKTDLRGLLLNLLENFLTSLDADIAILEIPSSELFRDRLMLDVGEISTSLRSFLEAILQGVMASVESVVLGDMSGDPSSGPGIRSLISVPLLTTDRSVVGAILLGNWKARKFSHRQLALLQTVAGQVALVVQNASLMAELEYKTMMQERTRLAREIHDGLAQTLGFLKLQVAQMRNQYTRGDKDRVNESMDLIYSALSEAYQDARQSIDGLRINPEGDDLSDWLYQTVQEYEDMSGIKVAMQIEVNSKLPPEVHAQLVRIVQEALSNIRKHSDAHHAWVDCHELDGDLVMEVRDDGIGFLPEDVAVSSRYGLRGMRERSELLGADFQVISQPNTGTTIRIRMPLRNMEEYLL